MKMLNRRKLIQCLSAGFVLPSFPVTTAQEMATPSAQLIKKVIPSSKQSIAVIGMGTWQTFNVGSDSGLRSHRTQILDLFFRLGGEMVDSSPMYGSAQEVLGHALTQLNYRDNLFSAEKVWTSDETATHQQIQETANAWRVKQFDLMQVHNLVSWQQHLEVLKKMREQKMLRYIGVTTSHGRRHEDLEHVMKTEPIDFVQLTYSLANRDVEQRLLPVAKEYGIAVIANRPFQGGRLIDRLQRQDAPLPAFAQEIQCENWAQFLLKFVVSHPAVTCAIPATSNLQHMQENMGASYGTLPDEAMRQKMLAYVETL